MKNFFLQMRTKLSWGICFLDRSPIWAVGFLLIAAIMAPICSLGEGSVFAVHDQLDESLMNYVLTARHLGEADIPEILGGIPESGMMPSAILFLFLYHLLSPFVAFLCSYVILLFCGFFGMYFAVHELTDSGILALISAGLFVLLPLYPVYGLSEMGIPLVLYAFLCLRRGKKLPLALGLTILFGLTSHLVYTGYVVLAFWFLALFPWKKLVFRGGAVSQNNENGSQPCDGGLRWKLIGFLTLLFTYILCNLNLICEILLGRTLDGRSSYVSHREEMINNAQPFWNTVKDVFLNSAQHADSFHKNLILPIFIFLILEGVFYPKLREKAAKQYCVAVGGMVLLILIAVFYGFCQWAPVTAWKNSVSGFLHYFQMERFYWLYPAGWYLEFALVFGVWWTEKENWRILQCIVLGLTLMMTFDTILHNSYFYMNVNQKNNGSDVTGYITWESWYAEDLMEELEEVIGKDPSSYRVAHLGISPAPALMHGFYTVDGYSNNYPLEYKHRFRRIIAGELEKAPETAVYFDTWGNRCYLFNSQTGTYWMLKKGSGVVYENLEFDLDALRELGCEYLFSGGEILDAEKKDLECLGYFETEKSYWGIWLYALN